MRDATGAVIDELQALADHYRVQVRAHCYAVRDREFNPMRDAGHGGGGAELYPVALAARLIFLNRTGYNGLFRLNASGDFNVPAGSYDNPPIVNAARLRAAAAALCRSNIAIACAPFEHVASIAAAGDLVYFDPPYAPLSATANFRSYTARGFSEIDQARLRDVVVALAARGVLIILSNSVAPEVLRLYDSRAARAAGLRCDRVAARRAINSRADARGSVDELVVTNIAPAARAATAHG